MKALFSLALIALLSGCAVAPSAYPYAQPPLAPVPIGGMPVMNATAVVTVGIGGQANVNGIRIVPQRVIEDSRCPSDVQCVWAGRLILEALIGTPGRADSLRQLTLGQALPLPGGTLTLVAAMPPKRGGGGPAASSFTFEWRGL